MELSEYCEGVENELTVWKAKLYDVMTRMDGLPTGSKQRMFEQVNGLHMVMAELEERIDKLRTECPTQWKPDQEEIRAKFSELHLKYNDASGVLFDYDYGG
jgi:hypothetical protein